MDSVKLAFIPHTEQLSQICKVYQNPHKIFINLVYGRSLYVKFWLCILNLNEVPSILMLKKSINRLLFSIIIFFVFYITYPSILNLQAATIHQIGGNVIWILQNLAVFGYLL